MDNSLQTLINEMEITRGIDEDTIYQCLAKLGEEYGELCQAILERDGVKVYAGKPRHDPADEIADCRIVLSRLALRLGVDIDKAVRDKLEKDKLKVYQMVIE